MRIEMIEPGREGKLHGCGPPLTVGNERSPGGGKGRKKAPLLRERGRLAAKGLGLLLRRRYD